MRSLALALALLVSASGFASAQEEKRIQVVWTRDLSSARSIAEREYRLVLLYFYGDVKGDGDARSHQKTIEDLFKQPSVKDASREYIGVRVSCHTFPAEAGKYGITKGPLVVVQSPEGREISRVNDTDENSLAPFLSRIAEAYGPKPVEWSTSLDAALGTVRGKRGLVLVAAFEGECKTCAQSEKMLDDRRLALLKQRLAFLKVDKKTDEEQLKALDIGAFPQLVLLRPGRDASEGYTVVHKKLWPSNAKALAEILEGALRELDP